jgi:hypothetical protein
MSATRACQSGCRIRSEHLSDCSDVETCRGCLPRPADNGVLCAWCWQRLAGAVADMPAMVAHLREIARLDRQPSAKPLSTDPHAPADPAHGTVLSAAWLAADDLWSLLGSWAQCILEEHPANLRGPNARPWHGDVPRWVTPHLVWAARQDWAPEMLRELAAALGLAHARWPTPDDVEKPRTVGARCPRCNQASLVYTPPSWERAPFKVACHNDDCGRVFSEDEWERFVHLTIAAERMSA